MKKFRPGLSFGDFVQRGGKVWKNRAEGERDYRRGWVVWLVTMLGLGLLLVRAFDLQVLQGGKLRVLADENRVKQVRLAAPRGKIVDRNGTELARNEATAHIVGYLEDEVGLVKEAGGKYEAGSRIGRAGIEAQYEEVLRGMDGGKLVEVDNEGKVVRELGQKEPTAGSSIKLTLDAGLQDAAYQAVNGKKAGVVVSDPRNGEVLALVSSPSFDPNLFSNSKSEYLNSKQIQISQILNDQNKPLFNRAISGAYPPGSTFKMVTTAAALESGKVEPDFTFVDTGEIVVGSFRYTNWLFTKRGGVEGRVGFARAITRSTDTFFYKIGEMTGPENIVEWSKKMGLGGMTGIDLQGEVPGAVPDPNDGPWYLGNTYHLAIGQEDLLTTPLQINLMTNVLASSGRKCVPHLLKTLNTKSEILNNDQCPKIQISNETLEIIKKGMVGACSVGGTSFVMFDWNEAALGGLSHSAFAKASLGTALPSVACKTGTAEYVAEGGKMKTHGWLTAYAPADNPVISATVVIEGGGEGSNVAAPVVRKIFAKYFNVEDKYPYGAIRGDGE